MCDSEIVQHILQTAQVDNSCTKLTHHDPCLVIQINTAYCSYACCICEAVVGLGVKDTLSKAKVKDLPIQGPWKVVFRSYCDQSIQNCTEMPFSLVVTKMLIALEVHQVREHLVSWMYTLWARYSFPMTENVLKGADCWGVQHTENLLEQKHQCHLYGRSFHNQWPRVHSCRLGLQLNEVEVFHHCHSSRQVSSRWCSSTCVTMMVHVWWEERCSHNFSCMPARLLLISVGCSEKELQLPRVPSIEI